MKPVDRIEYLMEKFAPHIKKSEGKYRKKIMLNSQGISQCFFLYSGSAMIHRNDGVLGAVINAPAMFGMNIYIKPMESFYVKLMSDSEYGLINKDEALSLIDSNGLWKEVASIYMYNAYKLLGVSSAIIGINIQQVIANILTELSQLDVDISKNINAAQYIKDKTNLSRSVIMKYLQRLKESESIVIKKGVLLKINHFPDEFTG